MIYKNVTLKSYKINCIRRELKYFIREQNLFIFKNLHNDLQEKQFFENKMHKMQVRF